MVGASNKRAKRARTRRGSLPGGTRRAARSEQSAQPARQPSGGAGGQRGESEGRSAQQRRPAPAAGNRPRRRAGRGVLSERETEPHPPQSSGATQRGRARRRRAARSESKGLRRVSRVRPKRAAAGKPGSGIRAAIGAARSGRRRLSEPFSAGSWYNPLPPSLKIAQRGGKTRQSVRFSLDILPVFVLLFSCALQWRKEEALWRAATKRAT